MVSTRSKSKIALAVTPAKENDNQGQLYPPGVSLKPRKLILEFADEPGAQQPLTYEEKHPVSDNNIPECDDKLIPSKKRARASQTTAKFGLKQSSRGKQHELKGLVTMPVEIITEIAYLLELGDLLALARSNKFFRSLLLQRSAIHMWRRAHSNMPGLPPCPPDMCEPQYSALLFSKSCTLCGTNTTAKPNIYLRARLCSSCRDTELQELNGKDDPIVKDDLVRYSADIRPKRDNSDDERSRYTKGAVFAFKSEVKAVHETQQAFRRKRDKQGLTEWEKKRRLAAHARYKHATKLWTYFQGVENSHEEKLDRLKEQRRTSIFDRLKVLGWTQEDMNFKGAEAKPWHALVKAPKPLTDRIWTNMLPKLTPMLEENRARHITEAKKQRQAERRACVDRLFLHMKYTAHPFEPIFQALGVPTPSPPNFSGPVWGWKAIIDKDHPEVANPFPKTLEALEWECLRDIDETEMSIEQVEANLEAQKVQIEEKVLEWRTSIEQRLVERLGSGFRDAQNKDIVVADGSINSIGQISSNTRLLLRADTLFKQESFHPDDKFHFGGEASHYYPSFISSAHDYVDLSSFQGAHWLNKGVNLDFYTRDIETEMIAKLMLRDLGMPDVSHVELQVLGNRFMCGRCYDSGPQSWELTVWHFTRELGAWNHRNNTTQQPPVRHPIITRHVHDIDSPGNTKPLIRMLSQEEASKVKGRYADAGNRPICYVCEATQKCIRWRDSTHLIDHMRDVHDVTEPVKDIHFGGVHDRPSSLGNKWYEKWDAYHDARAEAAGGQAPSS